MNKLFYKRECQEKYSPAELEAGENRLAFNPLYRSMAGVCRLSCYPSRRLQFAWAGGSRVSLPPFSSCQDGSSERPGAVKGRAGRRGVSEPLDGEDRSASIGQRGKGVTAASVPETQQAMRM
jgi:hypothetical protein